ncbi:unnamed protein product [Pocillopora meandrina]|uniref:RNA-binding protein NOB1 n=1 Tax=Pocillopora meandrina TaxID=46732 RepID=A0AAU9W4I3_9CNID|nr:unnamed protein product [Pocillopora meandrina]
MADQMANDDSGKVKHIVADSAAFLKNAPLHEMCENVHTVEDVVNEIRDAATRQRLAVLPYKINFREPSTEALHAVTEFAKQTGDFRSLSVIDLKVLALTYQLEKEHCGIDHIKTKPTKQVEITQGFAGKTVPGFFVEKKPKEESEETELRDERTVCRTVDSDKTTGTDGQQNNTPNTSDECETNAIDTSRTEISTAAEIDKNNDSTAQEITTGLEALTANDPTLNDSKDDDEGFEENDNNVDGEDDLDSDIEEDCELENGDDDDDDDDDGWITPDNIKQIKNQMGKGSQDALPANVTVGCLTTDFAMQNVLIQMGLHVISLDGMLIREARSYVLKCYACFRVTCQLEKKFCPSCGNRTLVKVSVSVDEDGITHYHLPNRKKPFNIRGKKFPLPRPQGGRHSNNPVLTEDQPRGQHRLPRKKDNMNVFDPNYIARSSPFAAKDVTSRASQLGYHLKGAQDYQNRRNPNEVRKKSGRRKK